MKRVTSSVVVILILLTVLATGCSVVEGIIGDAAPAPAPTLTPLPSPAVMPTAFPTAAPPPTATDLPPPSPTPAPTDLPRGEVIYETDTFSGWEEFTDEAFGTISRQPNGFEFHVIKQALWMTSTSIQESAFYAELDVFPTQCPVGQAWYGMVFHFQDESHFRFFIVTCSGKYALYERNVNNRAAELGRGDLPGGVDATSGLHTVGVRVTNNTIWLYFDNQELGSIAVTGMPAGDIGPYIETNGAPATVFFKRMGVYQP